jgi:uncharacterized protein YndB with AHSA1/START domain
VIDMKQQAMAEEHVLTIVRTFDAPRDLVWKAMTDPAMAVQWNGPRGFRTTEFVAPDQPGSRWHMTMTGNIPGKTEGRVLKQGGTTLAIDPPRRLVYTYAWDDRSTVGLDASPYAENTVTIELEEDGDKTVMTFTQKPFATEGERDGHNTGWNSAFDKFAEFLLAAPQDHAQASPDVPTELHLKRFFGAPRPLVFDCFTRAEMLREWFGPRGFTVPVCEFDARVGGKIRLDMQGPDGTLYPSVGEVVEFDPPFRFNMKLQPLDAQAKPIFENSTSLAFAEVDGGTMVSLDVYVVQRTAAATRPLQGMTEGWKQTLDKLETWLAKNAEQHTRRSNNLTNQ